MILSPYAMTLLQAGQIDTLQSLTFDELVRDAAEFNELLSSEILASCPENGRDNVQFSTLVNPVAISSGHIFSRETIVQLFATRTEPLCPNTNIPIQVQQIIPLPQITYAIAQWKLKQKAHLLEQSDTPSTMSIEVGRSRIRINVAGPHEPLEAFLGHVFVGKNNNIDTCTGRSYSAPPWAFAWFAHHSQSRLEIWTPPNAITDADLIMAITHTTATCPLPIEQSSAVIPTCVSMQNIAPHEYATVFCANLTNEQIGHCFARFLNFMTLLRELRAHDSNTIDDRIISHANIATPKIPLGFAYIGLFSGSQRPLSNVSSSGLSSSPQSSPSQPSQPASGYHSQGI